MSTALEVAVAARTQVGEGPAWDDRAGVLWWVDITGGALHRFDPGRGADAVFDIGRPVGAAVPRASGGLVLVTERAFEAFDPASGALEPIARIEADRPGNRMNDGKCDRRGRFWAGTMAYDWQAEHGAGSLYRLDRDGTATTVLRGLTISNGLAWSADDALLYLVDSPTQRIDAFRFDADDGALSGRTTVMTIPAEAGMPDGMTIDREGFLWLALWGGGAVWRIDPVDGRIDRIIDVPARQVSSCAFGGADLGDLYITSAAIGLSAEDLADQPLAGSLFRIRPGVQGSAAEPYRG